MEAAGTREDLGFQLCAGLGADCTRLAALVRNQLTLKALFDAWKETQFQRVFTGRRNLAEQLEFVEEALVMARDLWLGYDNIREQASYFFVLAGLYLRQPFSHPTRPVRIRLTPSLVDCVAKFVDDCEAKELHDCIRLIDALFSEGAFDFSAHPRDFGLERPTLAYLRREAGKRSLVPPPAPTSVRDMPALINLRTTLAKYCAAKRILKFAPNIVTERRLDSLGSKVKDESDSDDHEKKEWKTDESDKEEGSDNIAERRQNLKNRAFTTAQVQRESVVMPKLEAKAEEPGFGVPAVKKKSRKRKFNKFY